MTTPIGLAFIVGQLGLGGAERQLYYLLAGLDRSRFHPLVISLGPSPHEHWEQYIQELGIPVRHVTRTLGRTVRALRIAAILSQEKVHVVHGWVFHTNAYAALAGGLANTALRIGSMRENYDGLPPGKFLRWIGYQNLDVMITNSASNAQRMRELRLTRALVQVVPNGVSIPAVIEPIERNRLRSELGCSDAELIIGSIGRIDENKNHSMLLRAFVPLSKKWPSLRLVIIGDGPVKPKLAMMARELGVISRVSFPGAIPLAERYLPAMEVCCLTSHTEGMPNSMMEAAAAGLPVVSTTCGDSGDLIEHGVSGFLVSPNDDVGMSDHLSLLMADVELRLRMGQAGQEKMRHEFSVDFMITRMSQVYEECLAAKGLV